MFDIHTLIQILTALTFSSLIVAAFNFLSFISPTTNFLKSIQVVVPTLIMLIHKLINLTIQFRTA